MAESDPFMIVATIASPLIAAVTLGATWWGWRSRQLRKSDVLKWTLECIETMQLISLQLAGREQSDEYDRTELLRLRNRVSVLAEQGRLFFKNTPWKNHGLEKPAAYQGLRPCILDELVIAYQTANAGFSANIERRQTLCALALLATKRFVTLAQGEVGRQRSASADASRGGRGIHLDDLLEKLSDQQLRDARVILRIP